MSYLIPYPARLEEREGCFFFPYGTYLNVGPGCSGLVGRQAALFNGELKKILGYDAMLRRGMGRPGDIVLRQDDGMKKQSYTLDIGEDGVVLTGDERGLWHGMQTLRQLVEQNGAYLPALHIEDAPEIENRGYYLDATRGRVPKLEWLKGLADRMAYYKLNQLQLYVEHTYLFRDLTELWRDDTPLTAAEILELDHYCVERGIELVPSLSSFGHLYKLLSTKEYAHLCELEDSDKQPFSVMGRMRHHTINVTDPESLTLVKSMIGEYMELFSSKQFNLCADETFDLGRGKSREAAEALGKDRLYIDYVKELAQFLVDNGRRPMFWGDIILGFPALFKELPAEMICLNWGYAWNQGEEGAKRMHEAGATLYCCPGCSSWNQLVPQNWSAYNNVSRMCSYAVKYGAIGVLNTDWGDFLHVNHPDLSRVGMIYGAAFSWNAEIPAYGEINRQISRMEYHDSTERLLEIMAKVQENVAFGWDAACLYREWKMGIGDAWKTPDNTPLEEQLRQRLTRMADVNEKNARLSAICGELYGQICRMDSDKRALVRPYLIAVDGIRLLNELEKTVAEELGVNTDAPAQCRALAKALETWLYYYKEMYREVSKESELNRIAELVCWYADLLREREKDGRR